MISFLDMDDALRLSTHEDIDRIKLGHLYRIFFPRDATPLERSDEFFLLTLEQLKEKMFKTTGMKEIYDTFFDKMKPYEILPGKVRYRVVGLAEKAYESGARALTAALTGVFDDKELFKRTASILKMGIMSTETRNENGLNSDGLGGSGTNYWTGGADGVYTQIFTEKNIRDRMEIDDLMYDGKVRFLFKLDALETGSYQYNGHALGSRKINEFNWWWGDEIDYKNRPGILEFIQNEQNISTDDHELMFKERLDPSFLQGVIVQDKKTYNGLLDYLRSQNIYEMNGVAIDKFVRIGTHVTEELLA
jgi:hypothetical protein